MSTSNNLWNVWAGRPIVPTQTEDDDVFVEQLDRTLPDNLSGFRIQDKDRFTFPHPSYLMYEDGARMAPMQPVTVDQLSWVVEREPWNRGYTPTVTLPSSRLTATTVDGIPTGNTYPDPGMSAYYDPVGSRPPPSTPADQQPPRPPTYEEHKGANVLDNLPPPPEVGQGFKSENMEQNRVQMEAYGERLVSHLEQKAQDTAVNNATTVFGKGFNLVKSVADYMWPSTQARAQIPYLDVNASEFLPLRTQLNATAADLVGSREFAQNYSIAMSEMELKGEAVNDDTMNRLNELMDNASADMTDTSVQYISLNQQTDMINAMQEKAMKAQDANALYSVLRQVDSMRIRSPQMEMGKVRPAPKRYMEAEMKRASQTMAQQGVTDLLPQTLLWMDSADQSPGVPNLAQAYKKLFNPSLDANMNFRSILLALNSGEDESGNKLTPSLRRMYTAALVSAYRKVRISQSVDNQK